MSAFALPPKRWSSFFQMEVGSADSAAGSSCFGLRLKEISFFQTEVCSPLPR